MYLNVLVVVVLFCCLLMAIDADEFRRRRGVSHFSVTDILEDGDGRKDPATRLLIQPPDEILDSEDFPSMMEEVFSLSSMSLSMSMSMPITDGNNLPEWRFTVQAGIQRDTVRHYGGFEDARQLVQEQFETINSKFGTGGDFDGQLVFVLEDVYDFDGSVFEELDRPHPEHNYLVVYDGFPTQGGGWLPDSQSIYHSWPVTSLGGPFGPSATDGLVHEFGHTRGAVDIYALGVKAGSNPDTDLPYNSVNGEAYEEPPSIMNIPYQQSRWAEHTINIFNSEATNYPATGDFVTNTWPPAILFRVQDDDGNPLESAKIQLFPVPWYSLSVDPTPSQDLQYTTNADGVATIDLAVDNPYQPDESQSFGLTYPNFLVQLLLSDKEVEYVWMPFLDIQNKQVANPGSTYEIQVVVK